jgi:hypothetical protein
MRDLSDEQNLCNCIQTRVHFIASLSTEAVPKYPGE